MRALGWALGLSVVLVGAPPTWAVPIPLLPTMAGFVTQRIVDQDHYELSVRNSAFTGRSEGDFYRSYVVFEVGGLLGEIREATLYWPAPFAYLSGGASETVGLFHVDVATLDRGDLAEIYEDLGSGPSYGTVTVPYRPWDPNRPLVDFLSLPLNAQAVADLDAANAAGVDLWALGTRLLSFSDPYFDPAGDELLIGFSGSVLIVDVVAVPEPATVVFVAMGLAVLGFAGLRWRLD